MTTRSLALVGSLAMVAAACTQEDSSTSKKLDILIQKVDSLAAAVAAGGGRGAGGGNQAGAGGRAELDRSKNYSVAIENDPFVGPADAPVTLVKAYDYACPFCERVRPVMEELQKKYGANLRIVSKQLVVHPRNAMAGALAFCAAARQNKAHEMDTLIWDSGFKKKSLDLSDVPVADAAPGQAGDKPKTQKCWETAEGCANVVGYAKELGLNVDQFKADMKGVCQQNVQKDMRDLQVLGVRATPAFFVNGRFTSGAAPIETYSALIDEELAKAKAKISQGVPAATFYQKEIVEKGAKPNS